MKSNLISVVVGVLVAVVLIASLIIPTVSEISKTHETFDNTLYSEYQMKEMGNGDSWTHTDGKWYHGEDEITLSTDGSSGFIQNDKIMVQQSGLNRGTNYATNATNSFSVGDGTYSINSSSGYQYTAGFGAVPEGDYVLKSATNPAYILGDSDVFSSFSVAIASDSASQVLVVLTGSIDDGFTATATNVKNSTVTDIVVGDCTPNVEEVEGYDNLYKITSVTIPISGTFASESVSRSVDMGNLVIPKIVSVEIPHADPIVISLAGLIPIFCILAVFVGVAYVLYNRD